MQIAFVGDVMLGRLVNDRLRTADPAYSWGDTLPILRRADLRIANLECVLADGGAPEPGKVFTFRSDLKNVHALATAGIDAVSLANNHVLDYGANAFREMMPALDAAGILHAGAGEDLAAAQRPAVLRAGGTAVGFVAFTDNEPDWDAAARSPGVHYVPVAGPGDRAERLLELVRETSSGVQLLIVSAHWGGNWGSEPLPEHRALARRLVDAGADVVFGHSPHIVRGVEFYRDRPVIYGAGDFIDDYAVDPVERNDRSFIFLLEADDGVPQLLRLFPTVIAGCQARMARGDARGSTARMARLCAALGTAGSWNARDGCLELRPR
ncbi:CapA family protein [Arthrobacter sp. Soil763]|uniref:CapA family protein n=1 Tax=Arthrobacter sp. Soil763 TaxID=1736402 RepID=UPI0006F8FD84|nr:CapA family protein [Arthrobacter sp. Soil763]KRE79369.1 capsular biosynthesis protein [Arthrobacter sp. Soil763]